MKKAVLPAMIIGIVLTGCGGTNHPARIAVLQNPETKQTVECRVDPWGSVNYGGQVDNCITAYQKAGYKLVADSAKP